MKLKIRKRRGFTLVELLVVITIMLALAGMAYPVVMGRIWDAEKVKITNNAKNIALALSDFDRSFNSYPDERTAERIEENPAYLKVEGMTLYGDSSNPYFRQLLATLKTDAEDLFYANITPAMGARPIKPDKRIANGMGLVQGENAYGYVMLDRGEESIGISGLTARGDTPIMVTLPNITDNAGVVAYDVEALKEQVFVIRADNSAEFIDLDGNTGLTTELFREDARGRQTIQNFKVYRPDL